MNWFKLSQNINSEYLYHGTAGKGRLVNIQNNGLKPGQAIGNTSNSPLYFSNTESYAQTYANRKGIDGYILRIKKTPNAIPDVNTKLKGDYKILNDISPEEIEIKTKDGKWVPIKQYNFLDDNYELV